MSPAKLPKKAPKNAYTVRIPREVFDVVSRALQNTHYDSQTLEGEYCLDVDGGVMHLKTDSVVRFEAEPTAPKERMGRK